MPCAFRALRESSLMTSRPLQNAGTIYFHSRWWNQTTFPKAVMRDCKSKRPGMLMHSKVLYVRNPSSPSPAAAGFAYVGSANLSESAW